MSLPRCWWCGAPWPHIGWHCGEPVGKWLGPKPKQWAKDLDQFGNEKQKEEKEDNHEQY